MTTKEFILNTMNNCIITEDYNELELLLWKNNSETIFKQDTIHKWFYISLNFISLIEQNYNIKYDKIIKLFEQIITENQTLKSYRIGEF